MIEYDIYVFMYASKRYKFYKYVNGVDSILKRV